MSNPALEHLDAAAAELGAVRRLLRNLADNAANCELRERFGIEAARVERAMMGIFAAGQHLEPGRPAQPTTAPSAN